MAWSRVLEGRHEQRALAVVHRVMEELAEAPLAELEPPGLISGQAGLAIFFHHLRQLDARAATLAEQAAERALNQAAEIGWSTEPQRGYLTTTLHSGLTGVAWMLWHLGAGDDALAELDEALDELLSAPRYELPWDLRNGLAGQAVYCAARAGTPFGQRCMGHVVRHLADTAVRTSEGITWRPRHTIDDQRPASTTGELFDVSLAHGVPSALAPLAAAVRAGVEAPGARELLQGALDWLLAADATTDGKTRFHLWFDGRKFGGLARFAWCVGDPGVALAAMNGALALGDAQRLTRVHQLASRAAEVPVESGESLVTLCCGAPGVGLCFQRLFHATQRPEYRDAAVRWYLKALEALEAPQGWPASWKEHASLHFGTAGVALALLSAATHLEPTWDSVFHYSV